jgi:uncharacterized protein (TIGR00730 family)
MRDALQQRLPASIITGSPGPWRPATSAQPRRAASRSDLKKLFEQRINEHVETGLVFDYFFVRKVMFVKYACGFVGLPGGFGTLDEIFEAITLKQTGKMPDFPVVLYGRSFWEGLLEWLSREPLQHGMISAEDLGLIHITDSEDELVEVHEQYSAYNVVARGDAARPGLRSRTEDVCRSDLSLATRTAHALATTLVPLVDRVSICSAVIARETIARSRLALRQSDVGGGIAPSGSLRLPARSVPSAPVRITSAARLPLPCRGRGTPDPRRSCAGSCIGGQGAA